MRRIVREKIGKLSFATFLVVAFGFSHGLYAAESGTVTVRVTVTPSLSITINPTQVTLNPVPTGGSVTSTTAVVVTNTSSGVPETLLLNLANPSGWSAGTAPGVGTFVLNGAFDADGAGIVWDPTKHATSTQPVRADAIRFAGDQTGANIPAGGTKSLWFQFRAPTQTSVTTQQEISVTITAELP